jgi:hypothetical protein
VCYVSLGHMALLYVQVAENLQFINMGSDTPGSCVGTRRLCTSCDDRGVMSFLSQYVVEKRGNNAAAAPRENVIPDCS